MGETYNIIAWETSGQCFLGFRLTSNQFAEESNCSNGECAGDVPERVGTPQTREHPVNVEASVVAHIG